MSEERPNDDPRERGETAPTKGTDRPWDRAGQQSQDPAQPDTPKPDLEKWKDSNTH